MLNGSVQDTGMVRMSCGRPVPRHDLTGSPIYRKASSTFILDFVGQTSPCQVSTRLSPVRSTAFAWFRASQNTKCPIDFCRVDVSRSLRTV